MLVSVMGDSMSTFEGFIPEGWNVFYTGENCEATGVTTVDDTWWMQVIRGMGGEFLANASWSGSCVEGVGYPAGESRARTDALQKDGAHPDVVLIFMGINDFGWGGTMNQMLGRGTATPTNIDLAKYPVVAPGPAPVDAAEKFGEAYSRMLQNIVCDNPGVEVWCLTLPVGRIVGAPSTAFTYPYRGNHFDRYNNAIRVAAGQWPGCHVADCRALMLDYEAVDGTHPTKRGMEQIASMVLHCMGLDDAPTDCPRSEQVCFQETCIGCPYARGTAFGWNTVCELSFPEPSFTNIRGVDAQAAPSGPAPKAQPWDPELSR